MLWLHQRWIGGDQFFSGLLSLAEQGYVRGKVRHLQLGQAVLPLADRHNEAAHELASS